MPAVHLFGQRTLLGGDDLQVPSLLTIVARIIQFTLLVVPLSVLLYRQSTVLLSAGNIIWNDPTYNDNDDNDNDDDGNNNDSNNNRKCHDAHYFLLWMMFYLVATSVFCIVSWILEYRIYYWSCQGTPTIRQPRTTMVEHLLEYKLGTLAFMELLILITFVVAVVGYAKPYHQCPAYDDFENNNGGHGGRWVGGKLWWILVVILFLSQSSETFIVLVYRWRLLRSASSKSPAAVTGGVAGETDGSGGDYYDDDDDQDGGGARGNGRLTTTSIQRQQRSEGHELTEELWADRCQSLFYCLSVSTCFLFGGHDIVANARQQQRRRRNRDGTLVVDEAMQAAVEATTSPTTTPSHAAGDIYSHLAQALADYLETRGTLDVVPTDLVTGLLVLQRLQRQRMLQARREVVNSQSQTSQSQSNSNNSIAVNLAANGGGDANGGTTVLPYESGSVAATASKAGSSCGGAITQDDLLRIEDPLSSTGLRARVCSSNDLKRRAKSPSSIQQQPSAAASPGSRLESSGGSSSASSSHGSVGSAGVAAQHRRRESKPATELEASSETARLVSSLPPNLNALLTNNKNGGRTIQTETPLSIHMSFSAGGGGGATPNANAGGFGPRSPLGVFQQPIYRRCHSTDKNQGYFHSDGSLPTMSALAGPTVNDRFTKPYYKPQTRQVLSPNDPIDVARLEEGSRMAKYALAIYTWKLYLYAKPFSGLTKLCCRSCNLCSFHQHSSRPGSGPGPSNGNRRRVSSREDVLLDVPSGDSMSRNHTAPIHDGADPRTSGDNICQWHKHAMMLVAGLPESDLVYAQFQNRFSMVPYCIMVDHQHSHVILSIRGSLSLEDIVTDTLVKPAPLDDVGEKYGFDAKDQYCHAGVRSCFENVMDDLQRHGILDQLLEHDHPDYELRIAGHSLGAGIAVLVSYALRTKFPTLKVFGYSPPGCTMTWELATQCQSWTTSFVLDNELVPRLSVLALEDLRDEVLDLIGRVKVPKYQIFQMSLKTPKSIGCCYGQMDGDDLEELTDSIHEILDDVPHDTLYQRQLREFLQVQDERKEARGNLNSRQLRLYPTGRMIHLMKTGEEGGCTHLMSKALTCCMTNSGFFYAPVYIGNDDLDEIVVSPTMGTDHFIDRMADELQKLSDQYIDQSGTGIGSGSTGSDHHEMV